MGVVFKVTTVIIFIILCIVFGAIGAMIGAVFGVLFLPIRISDGRSLKPSIMVSDIINGSNTDHI